MTLIISLALILIALLVLIIGIENPFRIWAAEAKKVKIRQRARR